MSVEALNKMMAEEVAKFNQLQQDMQRVHQLRQQLDAQLNENTNVKEVSTSSCQFAVLDHVSSQELDLLDSDARVFKLVGPALMKQDLKDAKDNVNNRIKYINDEL